MMITNNCRQILITIVEMIPMSQRICADSETVRQVGNVVLDNRTIDAFRNGSSAMERMTAEITGVWKKISQCFNSVANTKKKTQISPNSLATNYQKTVPSVTQKLTSNAKTIDAFPSKFLIFFCFNLVSQ